MHLVTSKCIHQSYYLDYRKIFCLRDKYVVDEHAPVDFMRFKVVARASFHSFLRTTSHWSSFNSFHNVFIVFHFEGYTLQVGYLELLEGMSAIMLESNLIYPRITTKYLWSVLIWMSLPKTFSDITCMPR